MFTYGAYVYIYIHIHIYIYTYIYICIHVGPEVGIIYFGAVGYEYMDPLDVVPFLAIVETTVAASAAVQARVSATKENTQSWPLMPKGTQSSNKQCA